MVKRTSLMLILAILAVSVQAGQGESEGPKEARLQKKSKLQQMLQTKLWQGLRAQKQVRVEEPEERVLKGTLAGEQPKNQEQTRTQAEKKTNMNDDQEKTPARIHKRPRDRAHEAAVLKGEGAGPGDGTGNCEGEPIQERIQAKDQKKVMTAGEPIGEAKQDGERVQKKDQLRDGSCNDGAAACMLKGEGAGPGDGTGECDGEPIQSRTQMREQKKIATCPEPQEKKVQARVNKQEKTQTGADEEDEFTPEFLMFLKSYFAEADARQQREGEMARIQQRLVKIAEAQKAIERTRKGR